MNCNKAKLARYFWCTLVISIIAICGAFIYISLTSGTKVLSLHIPKYYSSSSEKLTDEKCIPVCHTKECVSRSNFQLKHVRQNVDPCENFHEFVCGRLYDRMNPYESYSLTHELSKLMSVKLKSVLEHIEAHPESASGKLKAVYNSCMKHKSSDVESLPTILQFLFDIGIPGWPNLSPDFKFLNPNITEVILNLLTYQEYGFVVFSTKEEFWMAQDYTEEYFYVNGSLRDEKGLYETYEKTSRKYLVNRIFSYLKMDDETITRIFEESEAILAAIINLKAESERIAEENQESSDFLLDCKWNDEKKRNSWCKIVESLIKRTNAEDFVNKNYILLHRFSEFYIQNIFNVLSNFSDRSVANYLAINIFLNNMKELGFYFHVTNKKVDQYQPTSKWEKCVTWLSEKMTLALGYEYTKKTFTIPMIKEVQELAEESIRETADIVSHQKWMTEKIRNEITESVGGIHVNLEKYIEVLSNASSINEFYEKFHPEEGNYLHNVLEFKKFLKVTEMQGELKHKFSEGLQLLFQPRFDGGGGQIDIQLGLLFPPLFFSGNDRLTSLLLLGAMMFHEIGHNVESEIMTNVRQDTILKDHYEEIYKCIEDQYSQFVVESIGKNLEVKRLGKENFADIVAVAVFDKIIEKHGADDLQVFPNFSFPVRQQMYISSMLYWCSHDDKEFDKISYEFDTHSPRKYRLIGMMQNSKGFSEAFGCPSGSYMNPLKKCVVLE